MISASTRFWSNVDMLDQSGCWLWPAGPSDNGYGRFRDNGKLWFAHRFAYEDSRGEAVPDGLVLDHLCRVPACVNPAHLEAVTIAENTARGVNALVSAARRKTECLRGHPFDEQNTSIYNGAQVCKTCGREKQRAFRDRKKVAV